MPMKRNDPKYVRAYERGMLRSAFVSLFWGIIAERKKREGFTLLALAKMLGTNKGEISRWFNGDPIWTVNTIAAIANALNVDIRIQAINRETGEIFTPTGLQTGTMLQQKPVSTVGSAAVGEPMRIMTFTRVPDGSKPESTKGFMSAA